MSEVEPIRTTAEKLLHSWRRISARQMGDLPTGIFQKIFTKQEQKHIKRCYVQEARIILDVDSSAWLFLLNLKKGQVLKTLNQALRPQDKISGVLLRLAVN